MFIVSVLSLVFEQNLFSKAQKNDTLESESFCAVFAGFERRMHSKNALQTRRISVGKVEYAGNFGSGGG